MNKLQFLDCKKCVHLSEDIAAGTYEVFCSCPNTFFEDHEFTTRDNWAVALFFTYLRSTPISSD